MPLTIRQIERQTKAITHYRSTDVRVTKLQSGRRRNRNPVVRAVTYTMVDDMGNPRRPKTHYVTWVEGVSRNKKGVPRKIGNSYVYVSCTCPYFKFHSEVALHKRGAAHIKFSNGEDPVVKNPKERAWACKHLLAVFHEVIIRDY